MKSSSFVLCGCLALGIIIGFPAYSAPPIEAQSIQAKVLSCEQLASCEHNSLHKSKACIENKRFSSLPALATLMNEIGMVAGDEKSKPDTNNQPVPQVFTALVYSDSQSSVCDAINTRIKLYFYIPEKPRD
jgi:hypothetical protein